MKTVSQTSKIKMYNIMIKQSIFKKNNNEGITDKIG